MRQTYQICDVTVTLPALGSMICDSAGNEYKRGAICHVHLYALHPDWCEHNSAPQGYLVGRTVFDGYSKTSFNRNIHILMPDGYKLVALRVNDRGQPESYDSLPVEFVGGNLKSIDDAQEHVDIKDDGIFLNEAFMCKGNRIIAVSCDSKTEKKPGVDHGTTTATVSQKAVKKSLKDLLENLHAASFPAKELESAMYQAIDKALKEAMQPGGLLWKYRRSL
ncbi:hypothetical protein PNF79_003453 [Cronobacter dublinensis]|nr:hypothetical protein [Cronobacter dublinensis]